MALRVLDMGRPGGCTEQDKTGPESGDKRIAIDLQQKK
jgi:hypothetical protein